MVEHTAHHRGALTAYSRLLGKVPPMPYRYVGIVLEIAVDIERGILVGKDNPRNSAHHISQRSALRLHDRNTRA
jgi:hypothetical protein